MIDLGEIEKKKYNRWRERKNLVTDNEENYKRAISLKKDLTPLVNSAFFFHEITECNGFEFIAYSNIKFDDFIVLPNNAILVPWFLNSTEGKSINDPEVVRAMQMERESKFLYDGWIAIDRWNEENVRKIIQSISEAMSLFSLHSNLFFEWEPKYQSTSKHKPFCEFSATEISPHHDVFHQISAISDDDKRAIYRSISWLSNAKKIQDSSARFLFFILAIESLVDYIENKAKDDSCFFNLKFDKRTKKERKQAKKEWQEKCIKEKMIDIEKNPVNTIKDSYFDCVIGIKTTLKRHLELVLPNDSDSIKLLFDEKIEGKTTYELRHCIAHGSLDLLTEKQVELITKRLEDVEKIANKYILEVLNKTLNIKFPTSHKKVMMLLPDQGVMIIK